MWKECSRIKKRKEKYLSLDRNVLSGYQNHLIWTNYYIASYYNTKFSRIDC